ncbi:MAG TPA: CDP-glucose 4,6-dehydratase [Stellaceae bacterium]|nr:CDP-glucose 4,6-dehydratase [Stellaceae bacterium]
MPSAFWGGKRVLLTGHTGFKGAWLALLLERLGAEVTGLALPPDQTPSLFDVAGVDRAVRSLIGDVRDLASVEEAVRQSRAEIVFHLAAQAIVRRGYREPVETYAANVMGTVHVLEAIRHAGTVRAAVIVTSDKCYENRERLLPYREEEPMGGHDPYSSSKGCAELVVAAYRRSFLAEAGIGVASARAGNVIGGGDWSPDRLVPDLIRGFVAARPTLIRSPDAIRPWQHVLDALAGYLLLAERLWAAPEAYAAGWNFGPGADEMIAVRQVADRLAELWGDGAGWTRDNLQGVHEAHLLTLDSTKARAELGWRPRLSTGEALGSIVDWHKAAIAGADMRRHSVAQVDAFLAQ